MDKMRTTVLEDAIVQRFLRTVVVLLLIYRGHCSSFQLRILQAVVYCDLALRIWFVPDILQFAERFAGSVLQRVILAFVVGHVPSLMMLNAGHCVGVFARVISSSHVNELQYWS